MFYSFNLLVAIFLSTLILLALRFLSFDNAFI